MSHLVPCPSCQRHVRHVETACPFCGSALSLATTAAPVLPRSRLSRAATFAFGATLVGAALGACGGDSEGGSGNTAGQGTGGSSNQAGTSNNSTGGSAQPVYGAPDPGPSTGGGVIYGAPPQGGTAGQGGTDGAGGEATEGGAGGEGGEPMAIGGTRGGPQPVYGAPPAP